MDSKNKKFYDNFERHDFLSAFISIFLMPILNSSLFSFFARKFVSLSGDASETKKYASHYKSMEVMYTFDHKFHFEKGAMNAISNFIAQHFRNPRALRNRLRLVKSKLKDRILASPSNKITILSLGAGSSRSVFETIHNIQDKTFKVILVDKNEEALEFSKKQAKRFPFKGELKYVKDDILNVTKFAKNLKPDIVEMVGLLEYIDDKSIVSIFNAVFKIMPQGSILITSNINYNKEMKFLENIIEWPLIYRDKKHIIFLFKKSEFHMRDVSVEYEPLNIHAVITSKK